MDSRSDYLRPFSGVRGTFGRAAKTASGCKLSRTRGLLRISGRHTGSGPDSGEPPNAVPDTEAGAVVEAAVLRDTGDTCRMLAA